MFYLDVQADKVEIVLDHFGNGMKTSKVDDDTARAFVKVHKSVQFFDWVAGMGNTVKITRPKSLTDEYIAHLNDLIREYAT